MYKVILNIPGAVALSDARPPGMRTVVGSVVLVMKKYLRPSSPFADSRRAVVSYWRKNGH